MVYRAVWIVGRIRYAEKACCLDVGLKMQPQILACEVKSSHDHKVTPVWPSPANSSSIVTMQRISSPFDSRGLSPRPSMPMRGRYVASVPRSGAALTISQSSSCSSILALYSRATPGVEFEKTKLASLSCASLIHLAPD